MNEFGLGLELIKYKQPKKIKILILAKRFKEDFEKEKLKNNLKS